MDRGNDGRSRRFSRQRRVNQRVRPGDNRRSPRPAGQPTIRRGLYGRLPTLHVYHVRSLPAGVVVMRVGSSGVDIVSDIRTVMPVITIGARSLVRIVLRILVGRPSTRMFAKHEMS